MFRSGPRKGRRKRLKLWKKVGWLVYHTDLDIFRPVLEPLYPPLGRPAWEPISLLRSALVMTMFHYVSVDVFCEELEGNAWLAVLCGFLEDTPGASTLRDFFNRLYLADTPSYWEGHVSRGARLRLKKGEKLPPRHPGIVGRMCEAGMNAKVKLRSLRDSVHDALIARAVQQSVELGVIPTSVHAALDASPLYTKANSFGHKICGHRGRCRCPRRFFDPGARIGRDSRRNCYCFGHSLAGLVAAGTGLALTLYPASRADGTTLVSLMLKFRYLFQGILQLEALIADSAFDDVAAYPFIKGQGALPVIDPKAKASLRSHDLVTTLHPEITWAASGHPVCPSGHEMAPRGHAGPASPRFGCPLLNQKAGLSCARPCPFRHSSLVVNDRHNPRLNAPVAYGSRRWHKLYNERTVDERCFSGIKVPRPAPARWAPATLPLAWPHHPLGYLGPRQCLAGRAPTRLKPNVPCPKTARKKRGTRPVDFSYTPKRFLGAIHPPTPGGTHLLIAISLTSCLYNPNRSTFREGSWLTSLSVVCIPSFLASVWRKSSVPRNSASWSPSAMPGNTDAR